MPCVCLGVHQRRELAEETLTSIVLAADVGIRSFYVVRSGLSDTLTALEGSTTIAE